MDMAFKQRTSSGSGTPRSAAKQHPDSLRADIAQLRQAVGPCQDPEHLDRLGTLLKRVRELELQAPQPLFEDGTLNANDNQQVEDVSRIAELEKKVTYFSDRCFALESILFEEGHTSRFHTAVHQLLATTRSDAQQAERSLKDQAAVIAQLQDVVHTLTNQLQTQTECNVNLSVELAAAVSGNNEVGEENQQPRQKLEKPARFYSAAAGTDNYAQRVVDAAVLKDSSLKVDCASTRDDVSMRADVKKRLQHEAQLAQRGRSVDAVKMGTSAPSTYRGSPTPVTPRASRREPSVNEAIFLQSRASKGQQSQPPSESCTPRIMQRSPPLTARGPRDGVAASMVVWARNGGC